MGKDGIPQIIKANELDDFSDDIWTVLKFQNGGMFWTNNAFLSRLTTPSGKLTVHRRPSRLKVGSNFLESDPLKHKWVYRKLQRYTITVYEHELKKAACKCRFFQSGIAGVG